MVPKRLFAIFMLLISAIYVNCAKSIFAGEREGVKMTSVEDIDRFKNISTAPSAIKVQFKEGDKNINGIVRNDDLFNFLVEVRTVKDPIDYINFMTINGKQPLKIDLNAFKKRLGKRWCQGKAALGEKYFSEHVIFKAPMTFKQLNVKGKDDLLIFYFDFNNKKGHGTLKNEYSEKYTRNPAFIALLIDLGYDVVWGDYVPNLNIYTRPFFKEK